MYSDVEKKQARYTAARAKNKGRLQPQPCVVCGADKVEMHHTDYAQPLVVTWLCHPCHKQQHVHERWQRAPALT